MLWGIGNIEAHFRSSRYMALNGKISFHPCPQESSSYLPQTQPLWIVSSRIVCVSEVFMCVCMCIIIAVLCYGLLISTSCFSVIGWDSSVWIYWISLFAHFSSFPPTLPSFPPFIIKHVHEAGVIFMPILQIIKLSYLEVTFLSKSHSWYTAEPDFAFKLHLPASMGVILFFPLCNEHCHPHLSTGDYVGESVLRSGTHCTCQVLSRVSGRACALALCEMPLSSRLTENVL